MTHTLRSLLRSRVWLPWHWSVAGADLTIQDAHYHSTPLRWAEVLGQPGIAALIAQAGGTA